MSKNVDTFAPLEEIATGDFRGLLGVIVEMVLDISALKNFLEDFLQPEISICTGQYKIKSNCRLKA